MEEGESQKGGDDCVLCCVFDSARFAIVAVICSIAIAGSMQKGVGARFTLSAGTKLCSVTYCTLGRRFGEKKNRLMTSQALEQITPRPFNMDTLRDTEVRFAAKLRPRMCSLIFVDSFISRLNHQGVQGRVGEGLFFRNRRIKWIVESDSVV
ncbi:hypothetical protein CEXT_20871 [Caerostris extrusa]|uniref:Uncharacterized protein n=1 Tax=Caerostris extrusa TaxID=172846 RepID=A0AAV4RC56_CAEEX|nr:hypothetical protein CEXT_20871 [Caerostris extrusa]